MTLVTLARRALAIQKSVDEAVAGVNPSRVLRPESQPRPTTNGQAFVPGGDRDRGQHSVARAGMLDVWQRAMIY